MNCDTGKFRYITPIDKIPGVDQELLGGPGELLVSCDSIEPYLEGYRITLAFTNPYSIRKLSMTLRHQGSSN